MKTCNTCNGELNETNAVKHNPNRCNVCHNARQRAWRSANPDKAKKYNTTNRQNRYGGKENRNLMERLRAHNVTLEKWQELYAMHDGKCHSCKRVATLCIDHDHTCCPGTYSCGKCVRGLLCTPCNTALGLLGEDVKNILALIQYKGVWV